MDDDVQWLSWWRAGGRLIIEQPRVDAIFVSHPELDSDRDAVLLNSEDAEELRWLDCEIALEHLAGWHRRSGCPFGCLFRER